MFKELFKKFWSYFDLDKKHKQSYGLPEVRKYPMPPVKSPKEDLPVYLKAKKKGKRTLSSEIPKDKRQTNPLVKKEE